MSSADKATKVQQPTHVPDALVYDFDYNTDPEYCRDPHGRAADLIKRAPPIFWTPYNGGHWMFQSHAAVFEALRDYATFSSEHFAPEAFAAMMAELPEDERIPAPVPICIDPPQHGKLRQPLFSTFSPKAVAAMEGKVRALAERLIDSIAQQGHCEFQQAVADVYPVEIFLSMFGLPLEKEREYRDLAKSHLNSITPDLSENMLMMQSIASVMRETIVARRTDRRDDIISLLWGLEIEGEPMGLDLMLSYCVILFIAGLDTVVNALGFGVRHLAADPELQRTLRAQPELIPKASEELLRRYTFVAPIRILKRGTVYSGVQMKEGERVMMFLPAASVDAAVYPDPLKFDLHRTNQPHLAFGSGPHFCLGMHLARLELRIMYETMLGKLPEFRLHPDTAPTYHGSIIAGPSSIHLVWGEGVVRPVENKASQAHAVATATVSAPASSAQPEIKGPPLSIAGVWTVTIYGPTGPQDTTLELSLVNGVLGGTQAALGQVEKVDEIAYDSRTGKVSWINKISKPLPLKLKFDGVVEGGAMNGKIKASIMGSFPFTGVRH
ncbi:MAG: cytochrome P450 [Pseudomonadota bacterium]|nr:cytochrome P450 [Pseudomonadota bacterium]